MRDEGGGMRGEGCGRKGKVGGWRECAGSNV